MTQKDTKKTEADTEFIEGLYQQQLFFSSSTFYSLQSFPYLLFLLIQQGQPSFCLGFYHYRVPLIYILPLEIIRVSLEKENRTQSPCSG